MTRGLVHSIYILGEK